MEQIVHLIDQRPGYEAIFVSGGGFPVGEDQRKRTAKRKEIPYLEVQFVMMWVVAVNKCTLMKTN